MKEAKAIITEEDDEEIKQFVLSIGKDDRICFQLHGEDECVFHSLSLGGKRPPIGVILDYLAGHIGRPLRYVYGYSGERWKISFADYVP